MEDLTRKFVAALGQLHHDGNADPLVDLFSEDATLNKAGMPHGQRGRDGARAFWEQYRNVFGEIKSTFHHVVTGDGIAFLEWTSNGTLSNGAGVGYDGVSVLESGDGQTVEAFRTFYDTAAFLEKQSAIRS